jgi:hypothetical protein
LFGKFEGDLTGEVGKGVPCENDNFEGASNQRREVESKVHVRVYKAHEEEFFYPK